MNTVYYKRLKRHTLSGYILHYEKFRDGTVKCIEDEIPFELPEGWEWTRLGNITIIGTGATPLKTNKDYYENGSIPWITSSATGNEYITGYADLITPLALSETNCKIYPIGTLIIAMYGEGKTRGQISELSIEAATNQACAALQMVEKSDCLRKFIKQYFVFSYELLRLKAQGGQQPNLNQSLIASMLIPLPPLDEQLRIISKLYELILLIDVIDSDKADLQTTIQLTKSKILDLAIRGKLVPQDPNDEPASVLLERIRAAKQELIKQGKIKRDKKESVIYKGEDNSYYLKMGNVTETLDDWNIEDIPDSWGVCCLGEVCDYGNCTNVDTKDIPETAWILDLEDIEKDTGKVLQKLTLKERSSASTKHLFHKGQVLYSKLRPYLNKVVFADDDGFCTSEILPLDFNGYILPEYAKCYMMSPTFLRYANHCSYGVKMPRLGTLDGKKAVLTVPPINEQKRIADKVSQLFSLLDSIAENVN